MGLPLSALAGGTYPSYACLASLNAELSQLKTGTALIPMGQPFPDGYLFEVFPEVQNAKPEYVFQKDKDGTPIIAVKPNFPGYPITFDSIQPERHFIVWEAGRIRYCSEKPRDNKISFLLETKSSDQKFRVEIENGKAKFTKTPCALFGEGSCYLDKKSHCEDVKLSDQQNRTANSPALQENIPQLLKTLMLNKVKAMPREAQRTFTISKDLRSCDFGYLKNALMEYKMSEHLIFNNTGPLNDSVEQ